MKKISLLLMVCIILMTFASCAKKCRCTYKEIRNGRVISKETEVWEKFGDERCSDENWTETEDGITYKEVCRGAL